MSTPFHYSPGEYGLKFIRPELLSQPYGKDAVFDVAGKPSRKPEIGDTISVWVNGRERFFHFGMTSEVHGVFCGKVWPDDIEQMTTQQPTREPTKEEIEAAKAMTTYTTSLEQGRLLDRWPSAESMDDRMQVAACILAQALASAERDAARPHCHQVDAFRICSDCNKEFQLDGGRTINAWTTINQRCPHCGAPNQTWVELRDAAQAAQRKDGVS